MARAGAIVAAAAALLVGCALEQPPATQLQLMAADEWPLLRDDADLAAFADACGGALDHLSALPADRVFTVGPVERTAGELADGVRRACEIVGAPQAAEARQASLQREFLLLRSTGRDGHGEVLFTGYYEPVVEARRQPVEPFVHPLYEVPDDLVTVELADFGIEDAAPQIVGRVDDHRLLPYPDRESIDFGNGLVGEAAVLGYLADPVDAFFLHVQGSGTLVFPDGEQVRAGFAATNGRPYRSIGRLLIDDGLVEPEDMSMQAIRAYLEADPSELRRVLAFNPSYVFFRRLPADGGPLGCFGEPVVAGRSIATDRKLLPAPLVAWIRAGLPRAPSGTERVERFVVNLDTGSSIVGPGRVDLFFGRGREAGELAGRTKNLGQLYVLVPK